MVVSVLGCTRLLRATVPAGAYGEGLYTSPVARKNIVRLDVLRQLVRCEHLAFVSSVPGVVSERDMIVPLINLKEVNSGLVQLDWSIAIGRVPRDGKEVLGPATDQIDGPYATVVTKESAILFPREPLRSVHAVIAIQFNGIPILIDYGK